MMPDNVISQRKWRNFVYNEFKCPCCGKNETSEKLISLLDFIRNLIRTPMIINSGYRCKKHNKKIDGNPESEHLSGEGADIRCENSKMRYLLIDTALSVGFRRVGIGDTFIHLGISKDRPSEVIWIYP